MSFQGVYAFRPEDFAPHADGSPVSLTLDIEDARKPGQRIRVPLDPKMVAASQWVEDYCKEFGTQQVSAFGSPVLQAGFPPPQHPFAPPSITRSAASP